MFVLIDRADAAPRGRRAPAIYEYTGLAPVRALRLELSAADLAGGARARRRLRRAADILAGANCALGLCSDAFGSDERGEILRMLGLRAPAVEPVMRACSGRMALAALGNRDCELAAVYADRLTRDAADAIARLSQRVRSVALVLGGDGVPTADALYAYMGMAAVRAEGIAASAGLHLIFDLPKGEFRASEDSTAVSFCGDIPGLPPRKYFSAELMPPVGMNVPRFGSTELAAALFEQRIITADEIVIVRLL